MTDKPLANDWLPITDVQALKRLGKLAEESGELTAACSRCIIQGIDEREPTTGKPNREWLEDEIADVLTNIDIAVEYFGLDRSRIHERMRRKTTQLQYWHSLPIPHTDGVPLDVSSIDWQEGERSRMIGNTLVFRTYADKVFDGE